MRFAVLAILFLINQLCCKLNKLNKFILTPSLRAQLQAGQACSMNRVDQDI